MYYGKLEDGQEVAIKVLDVKSSQGPSEFFNEVSKISRHFNDVVVFNLVVRKIITTHLPILKLQINQVTLLSRC